MPALNLSPYPEQAEVLGPQKRGRISDAWAKWLLELWTVVNTLPVVASHVAVAARTAALSATAVQTGAPLAAGLYRVSGFGRATVAAGTSGGSTVTVGWTDGGASRTAPLLTIANDTAVTASGSLLLSVDAGTAVTYASDYASNPASVFAYTYTVAVERVVTT